MLASRDGNTEIVEALLSKGADMNVADKVRRLFSARRPPEVPRLRSRESFCGVWASLRRTALDGTFAVAARIVAD